MRTALFDADVIGYRYGHAATEDYGFAKLSDEALAIKLALEHVQSVVEACGADHTVMCWSDPDDSSNWRYDVMPTYKHNRDPSTRPDLYYPIREYFDKRFKTYWRPTLEADDVMGILQTHPKLIWGEKVIITVDKDLLQIPGRHYNPSTGKRQKRDRIQGDHLHMVQTLAGDPVDGYDGIYGIGWDKAEKILAPAGNDPGCMWELVVRAYIESGEFPEDASDMLQAESFALANARVAKILQWTDYDYKRKEVKIWNPPH